MKKYLVSIGVVFVVLMASLTAFGKDEEKKGKRPGKGGKEAPSGKIIVEPFRREEGKAGRRPLRRPRGEEQMKNIEKEIERLESRHEKSIDELKAILMMAQKEQAPETGKLLQKLIEKRQRAFKNQLKRIEQRRERLRMRKEGERPRGPGRPRKPGEVKEREGWPSSRDLTPEERAERREKWRNMSEQEKEELMAKWRERWKNLSEEEKEKLKAERRSRRDKAEKK